MINDDILIKLARSRGHRDDWPEYVRNFRKRLLECKLGFPGLGNDHITILNASELDFSNDLWIYDPFLETKRFRDDAPMMLSGIPRLGKFRIEGIGNLMDLQRDPDRINFRWKDIIDLPAEIKPDMLVLRVYVRPTFTGGPGYYYFFKSFRDNRP